MRCEKTFQEKEAALAQSQMGENKVCLGTWVAFQHVAHAQKAWQELMGVWGCGQGGAECGTDFSDTQDCLSW